MKQWLSKFSFKTGLIILGLCVPFYILSFAQMALNISYTTKGILWVVLFGLAKTFQYGGIAIIGVEGLKKLKNWLKFRKSKDEISNFADLQEENNEI